MKLYEISNEYQAILETISEDGEITEESIRFLDELKEDFENKAIAVASYIKNLEAEDEAINQALEGMKKRKLGLHKKIESLTDYLQFNLQTLCINEIKSSPYFKIKLKQCPLSVNVYDQDLIPVEYFRTKIVETSTVDKIKLKEILSEGVEIPGCVLQRNVKLEIK